MRLGTDQRQAAGLAGSPVRVVAGSGTGKTAVIAERYRLLVESGAAPAQILVMTFTERAANEMRQRIEQSVGATAPAVGTFHSVALGWLREDGRAVGVPAGFRILAGADRWILARELMWKIADGALTGDERPDDLVAPVLQMLERMKQELVPIERLERWAASLQRQGRSASSPDEADRAELMGASVRLFRAYERACRKERWLDFDDLLLLTVRMFEKYPAILKRYTARHPHVLVDEYQDLNLAQERLVELLASGRDPFVVGDDDQSIYRFRGASRASLERFLSSFPQAHTVTLGLNRRSSRRIVAAASALITNNSERLPKELRAGAPGRAVEIWRCADGAVEGDAIAREARGLAEGGVPLSHIAVLCRTNAMARPIAEALRSAQLPHVVVGGHGFYDRPEVKDLIAMLRLVRDPGDLVALARPAAGARQQLLERLSTLARRLDVRDLFFDLMEQSGYLAAMPEAAPNVGKFGDKIAEFCEGSSDRSLDAYMRYLDLVLLSGEDEEPAESEPGEERIQVMTIHQSKGLEFEAVFVPSLVEGRLPQFGRSPRFELPPTVLEPLVRAKEDVIAEERRLLYVAMTRARRRLYLTHATHYEGGRRWRESRFLDEVRSAGARAIREKEVAATEVPSEIAVTNGHDTDVHLSYSAISSYRDCPRQYWYRYVQRLPVVQSAEAVHGVILHEVLRQAGELRRQGKEVTSRMLSALHEKAWRSTPFPDPRRAPAFKRNGAANLEAYRARGGFDAIPAFLEQPFDVAVDPGVSASTSPPTGGWKLRGIIDRVDPSGEGWRIIDYKSGRPVTRRRRDLQVALYALAAASALNLESVELEVVYLASGESVRVEKVDRLIDEAQAVGSQVAEGVRAGSFEPRPERRRCRLCPYRLACTEAL